MFDEMTCKTNFLLPWFWRLFYLEVNTLFFIKYHILLFGFYTVIVELQIYHETVPVYFWFGYQWSVFPNYVHANEQVIETPKKCTSVWQF